MTTKTTTTKAKPAPGATLKALAEARRETLDDVYRAMLAEVITGNTDPAIGDVASLLDWTPHELERQRSLARAASRHLEAAGTPAEREQAGRDLADAEQAERTQTPTLLAKITALQDQVAALRVATLDASEDVRLRHAAVQSLRDHLPDHTRESLKRRHALKVQPLKALRSELLNDGGSLLLTLPRLDPADREHLPAFESVAEAYNDDTFILSDNYPTHRKLVNPEGWRRFLTEHDIGGKVANLQARLADLDGQIAEAKAHADTGRDYWEQLTTTEPAGA